MTATTSDNWEEWQNNVPGLRDFRCVHGHHHSGGPLPPLQLGTQAYLIVTDDGIAVDVQEGLSDTDAMRRYWGGDAELSLRAYTDGWYAAPARINQHMIEQ